MKTLVISNVDPRLDDITYTNDRGSWNITRALRDCHAGKHQIYTIEVAGAFEANRAVEVDAIKIAELAALEKPFEPLIGVMEEGKLWIIAGHHSLHAMQARGDKECACYIIEEDCLGPYLILYNGQRHAPFVIPGSTAAR